ISLLQSVAGNSKGNDGAGNGSGGDGKCNGGEKIWGSRDDSGVSRDGGGDGGIRFLVPFDDEVPIEDQPLPADASPTSLSSGYITDSDPDEDPEEDPEKDPAEYPTDGGDDDDNEEEEHLAPADTTLHAIDPILLADDIEAFETDESVPTPPSPRLCRAVCFTALDPRFEVGESSVAVARQLALDATHATDYSFIDTVDATPRRPMSREVGYGITDVWDDMVRDIEEKALTTLEANVIRAYTDGPGEKKEYEGSKPVCPKCNYHHVRQCAPRCNNCKKVGHLAWALKERLPEVKEQESGQSSRNNGATTRAYAVGNAGKNPDSNVVTSTFHYNNRYASILFDNGTDRSFVSTAFNSLIDIVPTAVDHDYDVKLANGKIIGVNTIIRGCTLNFLNHPFNIDLMTVEIGSFDVIIGMDWLAKYHAIIVKGTDVLSYNQRFQELALMCSRLFPEGSDEVEKAYTDGPGEKKVYGGSKPVCPKCNYHHVRQCAPRCNNYKKVGYLAWALQERLPEVKEQESGQSSRNNGATTRAYAVGNAGKNPDSNVVTGVCRYTVEAVWERHDFRRERELGLNVRLFDENYFLIRLFFVASDLV
nr:hypothetical protein [Tanacetum cinerariifolium]